jgi:putative peptidoglycan lipid II flippase
MSAAFIPTFTRELTLHGRERAWHLANSVINALLIVTGIIVVFAVVFAGPLVNLYASNYSEVPGKLELTIYLARVVTPFLTSSRLRRC